MEKTPMKVLLVEDDENECNVYRKISKRKTNFNLVAITNSSTKAIEYLNEYNPEAVILDLELTYGEGSGFDFIEQVKNQKIDKMPIIIVTTNVYSDSVYDFCHRNKIDFIFYKKQTSFSQEKVVDMLFLLKEYEPNNKVITNVGETEDEEQEAEAIIIDKINRELDLIGVSSHLQGRKYLCDAIYFAIKANETDSRISITQNLVSKYKKPASTINRAMQNAIIHGWRISSIEDLTTHYTAKVNYETGVPTPSQLIYYYADKIRKEL